MSDLIATPYVMFEGKAGEAMSFYQSIIGGQLDVSTYGDAPMDAPPEIADNVIHAQLAGRRRRSDDAAGRSVLGRLLRHAGRQVRRSLDGQRRANRRSGLIPILI